MTQILLWILIGLGVVSVVLLARLLALAGRRDSGLEGALRDELRAARSETGAQARDLREEVARAQKEAADSLVATVQGIGGAQDRRLQTVQLTLDERVRALEATFNERVRHLQESNETRLDEMRRTVDEKLQSTLEQRLGESFRLVSERLEAVQRGLGEMRKLADGVGELKRVLTNVKTRGTWGEVQLGAILEDVLTPEQFARNVQTKANSRNMVEYAIRLPGREGRDGEPVWLPIDSKFPLEDYQRLVDATERADAEGVKAATTALLAAVRTAAANIRDRYLDPPRTTDFAILFLPTEGLYAEVLRQPGEVERLQQTYRVVAAGPTTLTAIVTSLRMGFRTLAIEKRSSEVWQVLAAVKTEFGRFGDVLARAQKQLSAAHNTLEAAGRRTRAMERKLRAVEALPGSEAAELLELDGGDDAPADDGGDDA